MQLLSLLLRPVINFIVYFVKESGVRAILILLLLFVTIGTVSLYYDNIGDYRFDEQYLVGVTSGLSAISPEEAKPYLRSPHRDGNEYYTVQMKIQNMYDKEIDYPYLHEAEDTRPGYHAPVYSVDHDYQSYYYDLPKSYTDGVYYEEVIPPYATLSIPAVVTLDLYDPLTEDEREGLVITLEPGDEDLIEDNTITLQLPEE